MQILTSAASIGSLEPGHLIYHYRVDSKTIRSLLGASRALITIGMLVALLIQHFYLALLLGLLGVMIFVMSCLKQRHQIWFHEWGALECCRKSASWLTYDQFKIYKDVVVNAERSSHLRMEYCYKIQVANRRKITLYQGQQPWEIGELIQQQIGSMVLPKLLNKIEQGKLVRFGKIRLSQLGMKIGRNQYAWAQGFYLQAGHDRFLVRQLGSSWGFEEVRMADVPNPMVLERLLETLPKFGVDKVK